MQFFVQFHVVYAEQRRKHSCLFNFNSTGNFFLARFPLQRGRRSTWLPVTHLAWFGFVSVTCSNTLLDWYQGLYSHWIWHMKSYCTFSLTQLLLFWSFERHLLDSYRSALLTANLIEERQCSRSGAYISMLDLAGEFVHVAVCVCVCVLTLHWLEK